MRTEVNISSFKPTFFLVQFGSILTLVDTTGSLVTLSQLPGKHIKEDIGKQHEP